MDVQTVFGFMAFLPGRMTFCHKLKEPEPWQHLINPRPKLLQPANKHVGPKTTKA